jgi:hypothetical protein
VREPEGIETPLPGTSSERTWSKGREPDIRNVEVGGSSPLTSTKTPPNSSISRRFSTVAKMLPRTRFSLPSGGKGAPGGQYPRSIPVSRSLPSSVDRSSGELNSSAPVLHT